MNRVSALSTAAMLIALPLVACGGGESAGGASGGQESAQPAAQQSSSEQAEPQEGGGEVSMPDWMTYDQGANTLTMDIDAGETSDNNSWNFNGYFGGKGEVFIPADAEVTVNFTNKDQNMAHSFGAVSERGNFPANFTNPQPVFAGAITKNPTSLTGATLPGQSETVTFTADQPGQYSFVCFIPGHAAVGMYLHFTVDQSGKVGIQG